MVALLLAITLTFGSLPLVSAGGNAEAGPQISLDICHPIQAVNVASAPCSLPIVPARIVGPALSDAGPESAPLRVVIARALDAPDPPPPRFDAWRAT